MALHIESRTRVETMAGKSKEFEILVVVHRGSVLSPLLFIIVMDEVTRKIRKGVPWGLMFADE